MAFWDGQRWSHERTAGPNKPTRARRVLVHSSEALLEGGLVALLVAGLIAGTAFAGKGNGSRGGAGGTVTGPVMVHDADANGSVTRWDDVTFDVSTSATDRPFVGLRCWQGSNWVYDGYVGYFDSYMFDPWFTLSSPYWEAGTDASCTARLFYYNKRGGQNVLATTSFSVAP